VRGLLGADRRWLRAQGVDGRALVKPLLVSGRHHAGRMAGSIIGTRADRLPPALRRRLSLEGRETFTPHDVPGSMLERGEANVDRDWPWEFVRRAYPRRPLAVEPHDGDARGPFTIAWVVPPWNVGSGGHTTIFRLVKEMERRGHRCSIHLFDPDRRERRSPGELRDEIRGSFVEVDAPVFRDLERFRGADIAIATEWRTAFPVRDLPGCREKVYLVQDDEPQFYATSSMSIWAEESYRMGYRCIAYTPWMATILRDQWGLEAHFFECGTDTDVYEFAGEEEREPGLVVAYARRETERRAVELALAGLATAFERRPRLRVVAFGSNFQITAPLPLEDRGVRPPSELAELYRRASLGLVFSLTTHSLVAHEMMASGLPVVELEGDNVSSALGASGELVELAERTPDSIADAVERLLDDRERAAAMAARARTFVEERTWERAGDQVEAALRDYMSRPRSGAGEEPLQPEILGETRVHD
jgi:glycosyltransferase involved in cell wall biosynthesis